MYNATVVDRKDITENLIILTIRPDKPPASFEPGQYVAIGLKGKEPRPQGLPEEDNPPDPEKLIKRQYSISSPSEALPDIELFITILPHGLLTSRLALLKPGSRIWVANKIAGAFTLKHANEDDNLIFIATGTGLAPFMSMLRTKSTWNDNRQIKLLHGVRFSHDLAYKEELDKLAEQNSNFRYYPIISRDDPSWEGERGYVQDLIKKGIVKLNPEQDRIYVCGNPAMVDDVVKICQEYGFKEFSRREPTGRLHTEKYW